MGDTQQDVAGYQNIEVKRDCPPSYSLESTGTSVVKGSVVNHQHYESMMLDHRAGDGGACALPLRTPDRRLLSSNNPTLEVRKRLLSPSSPDRDSSIDVKKRHVKSLFGGSLMEQKNIVGKGARCLFGAPSPEHNDQVMEKYNHQVQQKYDELIHRYEIIEEM